MGHRITIRYDHAGKQHIASLRHAVIVVAFIMVRRLIGINPGKSARWTTMNRCSRQSGDVYLKMIARMRAQPADTLAVSNAGVVKWQTQRT